jgi:hypothetical protein
MGAVFRLKAFIGQLNLFAAVGLPVQQHHGHDFSKYYYTSGSLLAQRGCVAGNMLPARGLKQSEVAARKLAAQIRSPAMTRVLQQVPSATDTQQEEQLLNCIDAMLAMNAAIQKQAQQRQCI